MASTRWVEEQTMFRVGESTDRQLGRPVEPWEVPVGEDLLSDLGSGGMPGPPSRPRSWREVPRDAAEALTELAGADAPADLLVFPAGTRPAGDGWVYVPTQVVGAGAHGVALWVADLPYERVAAVVPYRDLAMAENRVGRRYGRLTVRSGSSRLALRYRTAAWPLVRRLLVRIRAGAAQAASPSPDTLGSAPRWSSIGNSPLVCLDSIAAEITVSGPSGHWWRRGPRPVKAVLTARELVLVRRPARLPLITHGTDMLAVPRVKLAGLHGQGPRLMVSAAGVEHTEDLPPALVKAVLARIGARLLPSVETSTRDHPLYTDHMA
jgi:hypothetical protein